MIMGKSGGVYRSWWVLMVVLTVAAGLVPTAYTVQTPAADGLSADVGSQVPAIVDVQKYNRSIHVTAMMLPAGSFVDTGESNWRA